MFDTGEKPLVSVIMPAFNAENYIETSIESVQKQTFTNWELIIIDDGSADTTALRVKNLQLFDERIIYIYQNNRKLGAARNTGIKSAVGEWIAFLDSDDLWIPDKLEKQLAAAREHNTDAIFTSGYYLFEENQQVKPYDSLIGKFTGSGLYKLLFYHNHIAVLSVMIRMTLIKKVGLQDETSNVYGCEDWDYWLRCCRIGASFYGLDYRTFKYRIHHTGMSRNVLGMQMAGCYVLLKNFDASLFTKEEQKKAKQRLINEAKSIMHALYKNGQEKKVAYYLKLLSSLQGNKFKYVLAISFLKLLKQNSKRLVLFIIYH